MQPPGYPVSAPPPPQRGTSLLPLIALSCLVVLLVIAIVVVVAVRSGGHSDAGRQTGSSGSPTPAASASALIDSCLVGTWRTTSDAEQLNIDGVGPVTVTGQGLLVHIQPDGTTYEDYSQATPYEGTANDHTLSISITGSVRGTIRTDAGTISFHDVTPSGTVTAKVDGTSLTSVPLAVNSDPVQYTCSGSSATEHTSQYTVDLTKVSGTP
jgi:hypothetical protein